MPPRRGILQTAVSMLNSRRFGHAYRRSADNEGHLFLVIESPSPRLESAAWLDATETCW
jgi:hypothetical protein